MTPKGVVSLVVGAVFGGLDFWLLVRIVAGMVKAGEIPRWKTSLFFLAKMALLFLTIGLILWRGYVSPLPFLGGFTVGLIVGIVIVLTSGGTRKCL